MSDEQQLLRDWHRLFGLLLMDFFTDSPFTVEVERDLSVQQQLLDVVIVRRSNGQFSGKLPDGLEDLADHNLITFKSRHESLDPWAIKELVSHSVGYRKLVSPSTTDLLPEDHFRLSAVCARSPQKLPTVVPWHKRQEGVYDCQWGTDTIRVIVTGELSRVPHNAPLHLFSASTELIGYGQGSYQLRSSDTSRLLVQLFKLEGLPMPYTMEDFRRDFTKEHFPLLSPQERKEVLRKLPPEERLVGLTPEERLAGMSQEQIREVLEKLTAENKDKEGG